MEQSFVMARQVDSILLALTSYVVIASILTGTDGNIWVIEAIEDCMEPEEESSCDIRNMSVGIIQKGKLGLVGRGKFLLDRIDLFVVELTRCASKQEPETCMFFTTIRFKDACKKLELKDQMWSSYFGNADPPMLCPIVGNYGFEKSYVDLDQTKGLPGLEGYYWKLKLRIHKRKKQVCCLKTEVSMATT